MPFLEKLPPPRLEWQIGVPGAPKTGKVWLGQGDNAVELMYAEGDTVPNKEILKNIWRDRQRNQTAPLLLVVTYKNKAALCGPIGEPLISLDVEIDIAEQLALSVLKEPNRHAASRRILKKIPHAETPLPAIYNRNFFSYHQIETGMRNCEEFKRYQQQPPKLDGLRGRELLDGLGYGRERYSNRLDVLREGDKKSALAAVLEDGEDHEMAHAQFGGKTPAEYCLAECVKERLRFAIITSGPTVRLYSAESGYGVGSRGKTDSYLEIDTALLNEYQAPYLPTIFAPESLSEKDGVVDRQQAESRRFADELGHRLRKRIYEEALPELAKGIARHHTAKNAASPPRLKQLSSYYDQAMLVLFRTLFVAYAEDNNLLPYETNDAYRERSLKHIAQQLAKSNQPTYDEKSTTRWDDVRVLWRSVGEGNSEWQIPAYNGGLFKDDSNHHPVAAELATVRLNNKCFAKVLKALLVDTNIHDKHPGPVDFRSLSAREFGTIYEGLLESSLAYATQDLTTAEAGQLKPASPHDKVAVKQGEFYLHNQSGARKASGSYFTKRFAVRHLLDRTLKPALKRHLKRIERLLAEKGEKAAGRQFFDFRCADIAMGSGHFLVEAVDYIEEAFDEFLSRHGLPAVRDELKKLRQAAKKALGGNLPQGGISDSKLLRRQIARRCIYGVDKSQTATELARLAVWVHTFVPGLPLSLLDRTLVVGDSLAGIASTTELEDILVQNDASKPNQAEMFGKDLRNQLKKALKPLRELAALSEATIEEVKQADQSYREALQKTDWVSQLMSLATVVRLGLLPKPATMEFGHELSADERQAVDEFEDRWDPIHFPAAFPEVFLRDRAGFDVLIGNPPWEKASPHEESFWSRHFPGFKAHNQGEKEQIKQALRRDRPDLVELLDNERQQHKSLRAILKAGPYQGMGTGDPDLYKAFCWRFWELVVPTDGQIGVVLPRTVLMNAGSSAFRKRIFEQARCLQVTTILNKAGWLFEDVHPQYTVGLVAIERAQQVDANGAKVLLEGPYTSCDEYDKSKLTPAFVELKGADILSRDSNAALPSLDSPESAAVYLQLSKAPPLGLDKPGSWRARPYSELHATNDKPRMTFGNHPQSYWPVLKGASFNLWQPDTGRLYAWANPTATMRVLQERRLNGQRMKSSPFSEFSKKWVEDESKLPCRHPRIAFRDVTNRTNTRTTICALAPPSVFFQHKAPFFLWPRGDAKDCAFLLGVLSSIPLDWFTRQIIELSMTFYLVNSLPIPRPLPQNPLRQRVVKLAGRLACPDGRFADWARQVGVKYGPLDEDTRNDMIYELDAVVAHLYGLKEDQLTHIFKTFHQGKDYSQRSDAVVAHFRNYR